jgi:hypothetical protein
MQILQSPIEVNLVIHAAIIVDIATLQQTPNIAGVLELVE